MAKIRRKLLVAIVCVLALTSCMFCLTACGAKTYNVTFMVQNEQGVYQQYGEVLKSEDGSVTLPKAPAKDYYNFVGWYTDEACTTLFDDKNVQSDTSVYAKFIDKLINLKVKDNTGNWVEEKEVALKDLEQKKADKVADANSKNLEFIAWYVNEECSVGSEYTNASNASTIYGKYMAKVVFDNGYEAVKTEFVEPGSKVEYPGQTDFDKHYMDSEDIFYVYTDQLTKAFDFNKNIDTNTVIRVLWKTPDILIKKVEGSSDYRFAGFAENEITKQALTTYPVISIPGKVTVDGQTVNIKSALGEKVYMASTARKIIVGEGIEYLYNFNGSFSGSPVEEISLPKSLKIIEDSFFNFKSLKSLELPEGLEVILNCFWQDKKFGTGNDHGFNFEIEVPQTVTNIVSVPANLKYAENSPFKNEDGRVYKEDPDGLGKILISEIQSHVVNGKLEIPDGVKAIQVGCFDDIECEYVEFPASFSGISYNNDLANYSSYVGTSLTMPEKVKVGANPTENDRKMNPSAYSIISKAQQYKYIIFNSQTFPEGMNEFAIMGLKSAPKGESTKENYTSFPEIVIFIADVEETQPVEIFAKIFDTVTEEYTSSKITDMKSGESISEATLFEKFKVDKNAFSISDVKEFGNNFFDGEEATAGKKITRNHYLEFSLVSEYTGFTYEDNGDGTVTVTGFDKATAGHIDAENEESPYFVNITKEIDGKKVVAIKDEAFMNDNNINKIVIANSVKKIGARAFMGAYKLSHVKISSGGLEEIGDEAFRYVGAKKEDNKEAVVNPSLDKYGKSTNELYPATEIELPLGKVKTIGKYVFDSPAIRRFINPETEKNRATVPVGGEMVMPPYMPSALGEDKFTVGEYYYNSFNAYISVHLSIVKFNGISKFDPEGKNLNSYDFDYVANAPGSIDKTGINIGGYSSGFGGKNITDVISMNVLEGSIGVYKTLDSGKGDVSYYAIVFASLKSVARNAVITLPDTYLDDNIKDRSFKIARPALQLAFTAQQMADQDPTIFAEGWMMGRANAENAKFFGNNLLDENNDPALEQPAE